MQRNTADADNQWNDALKDTQPTYPDTDATDTTTDRHHEEIEYKHEIPGPDEILCSECGNTVDTNLPGDPYCIHCLNTATGDRDSE